MDSAPPATIISASPNEICCHPKRIARNPEAQAIFTVNAGTSSPSPERHAICEKDPWRHVIVSRQGSTQGFGALDTVLIARQPFTAADIARARAIFAGGVQQPIYYPGSDLPNQFRDLLLSPNPAAYERNYTFDITPVTDNRPFFFYTVQPRDLWA